MSAAFDFLSFKKKKKMKKRRIKSYVPLRVQRYIDGDLEKDLIDSLIPMEKTWLRIDGGNATAALDESVLFGKASPMVEHYYLNFPWPA